MTLFDLFERAYAALSPPPAAADSMSLLEFCASVIQSFSGAAWPVAFAIVAFRYRAPLTRLLARTKRVSLFGNEGEFFDDKLLEAELTADLLTPAQQALPKNPESEAKQNQIANLAKLAPEAAIVEKWKEVEKWLRDQLSPSLSSNQFRRFMQRPAELVEFGILDFEGIALLNDLRALRNAAAHSRSGEKPISVDQALRYIELADQLFASGGYMRGREVVNDAR